MEEVKIGDLFIVAEISNGSSYVSEILVPELLDTKERRVAFLKRVSGCGSKVVGMLRVTKLSFRFETVTYKGISCQCRIIPDLQDESVDLLVAPLEIQLHTDWEEGGNLDGQIAYYATPEEMEFSDKDLFLAIYN